MQVIILIRKLNRGLVEHNALLHAIAGGKVTGGNIADNDLQRHDGDLFHQSIPLGKLLDKMRGDSGLLHFRHQTVRHLVVDNALAHDRSLFQSVQRGGIILIGYDHQIGVLGGINLFCLALVQLLFLFHVPFLLS